MRRTFAVTNALSSGSLAIVALIALPGAAHAQVAHQTTPDVYVGAPTGAEGPRFDAWEVEVGFRTELVRDGGYAPFSENKSLTQASLAGTRTVFERGAWALALGLRWDFGGSDAHVRSGDAELTLHRLSAQVEGRYALAR